MEKLKPSKAFVALRLIVFTKITIDIKKLDGAFGLQIHDKEYKENKKFNPSDICRIPYVHIPLRQKVFLQDTKLQEQLRLMYWNDLLYTG